MKYPKVTRVEVIDETGRSYVNCLCDNVDVQLQDDNRTLKIFITKDKVNHQPNYSHNEAIKLAKKLGFPTENNRKIK